ncbi:hypothetical protein ACIHCQ_30350 [Streptomyces sp. NPDC052236]|uniref:hypothetical protein n=1 Tax=Streptomyces sp. NPDC052236 TaxID=3365686 RepID=UPI0037CD455C
MSGRSSPLLVAGLAFGLGGERLTRRTVLAGIVGAAGVSLLVLPAEARPPCSWKARRPRRAPGWLVLDQELSAVQAVGGLVVPAALVAGQTRSGSCRGRRLSGGAQFSADRLS